MKQIYMKHFIIGATLIFMSVLALPLSVYANDIRIEVNGELLGLHEDEQPVRVDNHIFLPLRPVAEALGLSIEWDGQLQKASLETPDFTAHIQIGSNEMIVDERAVLMDSSAQLINNRTMMSLADIAAATGMDVIWTSDIFTAHILEPFPPIENWPEHLPEHIPGAITLRSPDRIRGRHWSDPPMRFRHAFYGVTYEVIILVHYSERDDWWPMAEYFVHEDINQLMHFVQHFDISREDFDAAIERTRVHRLRMGSDLTDEQYELPNADIIFTFDNDLIRYFYRRE